MTPTSTNPGRPWTLYPIVAAGLLTFCLSPILVRYATDAPSLSVAVWRTLFAVLFLAPLSIGQAFKEIRTFSLREAGLVVAAGVLLGLHFVLWIESLYHTTVASAATMVATSPIFLALFGFLFLKERVSAPVVGFIALAMIGVGLIGWGDLAVKTEAAPNTAWGNLLALVASILFSAYLIIGRFMRRRLTWRTYVFAVYATVAVTVATIAAVTGAPLLGFEPKIYLLSALLAVGPQIIGHGSFNYAVKYMSATMLGLLALLEPIGASVFAKILFDEWPPLLALVGMVVVIVAVTLALRVRNRRQVLSEDDV